LLEQMKKIKKQYFRSFQAFLISSVFMVYYFYINKELSTNLFIYFFTLFSFIFFAYYIGKNEEKSIQLSLTDPLTKLNNSRYFYNCLNEEFSKFKQNNSPMSGGPVSGYRNNSHFSICILDLDKFKMINDNFGHPIGDQVLIRVSRAIRKNLRQGDIVARIGGEEFGIILPKCTSENALVIIERIRSAIKKELINLSSSEKLRVTASAGIASTDQTINLQDVKSLISKADNALYNAKNNGRNNVKIYKNKIVLLRKMALLLKKKKRA
jgi:diguanylate cyclase (GGDEF)-like protein